MTEKLELLQELEAVLAKAGVDGICSELASGYTNIDVVNEFCEAVYAMRAHEQEKDNKCL